MAGLRAGFELEFDKEHNRQIAESIDKLSDQLEMEKALAAAQKDGAEAVRQAGIAIKLRQMAEQGANAEQLQAEKDLYNAQRENVSSDNLAKLNEKIAATERLTKAILQGADAMRQANLENKLIEIKRAGGGDAEQAAARREDVADHARQVTEAAVQTDRIRAIGEQIAKLQEAKATLGDTLAIEIQLRKLENERLQAMADQAIQMGGLKDGVRAFFIEMQEDSVRASKVIHDAMSSSLDSAAANLAKLMTGQKSAFAKSFQEIGQKMTEESIKGMAMHGLKALGQKLGFEVPGDKPDGSSSSKALWVRMAGADHGGLGGIGLGGGGGGLPIVVDRVAASYPA